MTQDLISPAPQPARKKPKIPKKITPTYLHNAGLYYLGRFSASSAHFRTVMMRKVKRSCAAHPDQSLEQCTAWVDSLIENFERAALLNDEVYARAQVSSLRRRGKSKRFIEGALKNKGLDSALGAQELENYEEINTDAEMEAALTHARKKRLGPFRTRHEKPPEDLLKKDMSSLARAGFSFETVRRVLSIERD